MLETTSFKFLILSSLATFALACSSYSSTTKSRIILKSTTTTAKPIPSVLPVSETNQRTVFSNPSNGGVVVPVPSADRPRLAPEEGFQICYDTVTDMKRCVPSTSICPQPFKKVSATPMTEDDCRASLGANKGAGIVGTPTYYYRCASPGYTAPICSTDCLSSDYVDGIAFNDTVSCQAYITYHLCYNQNSNIFECAKDFVGCSNHNEPNMKELSLATCQSYATLQPYHRCAAGPTSVTCRYSCLAGEKRLLSTSKFGFYSLHECQSNLYWAKLCYTPTHTNPYYSLSTILDSAGAYTGDLCPSGSYNLWAYCFYTNASTIAEAEAAALSCLVDVVHYRCFLQNSVDTVICRPAASASYPNHPNDYNGFSGSCQSGEYELTNWDNTSGGWAYYPQDCCLMYTYKTRGLYEPTSIGPDYYNLYAGHDFGLGRGPTKHNLQLEWWDYKNDYTRLVAESLALSHYTPYLLMNHTKCVASTRAIVCRPAITGIGCEANGEVAYPLDTKMYASLGDCDPTKYDVVPPYTTDVVPIYPESTMLPTTEDPPATTIKSTTTTTKTTTTTTTTKPTTTKASTTKRSTTSKSSITKATTTKASTTKKTTTTKLSTPKASTTKAATTQRTTKKKASTTVKSVGKK